MAIELMARILARPREEIDPGEKLVLIVMADRADDDGFLWYAVDTIADKTSFTRRAVQRIMGRLITKGLVKKQHRRDRSNFYIIQVDRFPAVERKRRTKETGPAEYVDGFEEVAPDLFGTGDSRSGTGERRSGTGDLRSVTGDPSAPDSHNDSLNDPPSPGAHARGAGETLEAYIVRRWDWLATGFAALAPFGGEVTPERRRKIALRTKEWKANTKALLHRSPVAFPDDHPGDPETALWDFVMDVVAGSKLLTGQKLDWAPTFDWMLGPKNFTKIMEGNYGHGHDRIGAPTNDPSQRSAVAAGREARGAIELARERHAGERAGRYSSSAAGAGGRR